MYNQISLGEAPV